MANFYHIKPRDVTHDGADGRYQWKLPAVLCRTCRRYMSTKAGLPNLQLPKELDGSLYTLRDSIPKEEFQILADNLRPSVPAGTDLLPGMGFGSFLGTVGHREKRDLIWVNAFRILPKESAYQEFLAHGISLPNGPAIMEDFKTEEVRREYSRILEIKSVKCLAVQSLEFGDVSRCLECGVQITRRPTQLFLKGIALPPSCCIFAVQETDQIIASEAFKAVATKLKISNIKFLPVTVV